MGTHARTSPRFALALLASLGAAYREGFRWGLDQGYDVIIQMDCDFSHNPDDLVRLYEAAAEGNDVVARLRLADDRSPAIIRDILFVGDSFVEAAQVEIALDGAVDRADLDAMVTAVNALVACGGGIAVCDNGNTELLPLPVAGLMSTAEGDLVAQLYSHLNHCAKALGSPLRAPFMTLSFMALLVIPELKLSDRGLFDGRTFQFVELQP